MTTIADNPASKAPIEFWLEKGCLPLRFKETIYLCHTGKSSLAAADAINTLLDLHLPLKVINKDQFNALIDSRLKRTMKSADTINQEIPEICGSDQGFGSIRIARQSGSPIIDLANRIIMDAVTCRASDIHIIADGTTHALRYRIDGTLHTVSSIKSQIIENLITRFKIMAHVNTTDRFSPQDGTFTIELDGITVDVRLSVVPTIKGERINLRILDSTKQVLTLDRIGLDSKRIAHICSLLDTAQGLILATGPTGCGKTTTLYTFLQYLKDKNKNIFTIEDPVEYEIKGISQISVNEKRRITFASGLKAVLRQDPDIIMVGEIRDSQTANNAVRAAMTGHLVLSTLHTKNAVSAITRLSDLGVEHYKIADALELIIAQRLVQKRHSTCSGKGCPDCLGRGFYGRTGIFEIIRVDEQLRQFIRCNNTPALQEYLTNQGISTLTDDLAVKTEAGELFEDPNLNYSPTTIV